MAWFRRKEAAPAPPAVAERLETLERAVRNLQLDWDSTYDRIRVTMARINKRARVVEAAEETDKPTPDNVPAEPNSATGGPPGLLARLSDRQKEIQRAIMRRRGG